MKVFIHFVAFEEILLAQHYVTL